MWNPSWIFLLSVQGLTSYFTGKITSKERVIFFPTAASQWNSTHWKVPIHGWIFEPEEDSKKRIIFRSLLRRLLQVSSTSSEKEILDRRIKPFVVDNERWKRPKITLHGKEYTLNSSGKNGHFHTTLFLSQQDILDEGEMIPSTDEDENGSSTSSSTKLVPPSSLSYYASNDDGTRRYMGTIHFIPSRGITILSDIDDTIKITNVVNKKEMLRNTFLREFQPVPGMADIYQEWYSQQQQQEQELQVGYNSFHLHLLSASLYQLYEELETFRKNSNFPSATYSLKTVRPKNGGQTIRILFEDAMEFKCRTLRGILDTFPQRQFLFVGDTGEKDPQVYASIMKEYPTQILGIYLRSVPRTSDDNVLQRVSEIMKEYDIDTSRWTVFEEASELWTVNLQTLQMNR